MLELALIGAGSMGANHARVLSAMRDARLVAIVDSDERRGRPVAEAVGARFVPRIADLDPSIRGAVIATPTRTHAALAAECMHRGMDVLVEKPMTSDEGEAEALIAVAVETGRILTVGHVERFNPAVRELEHQLDDPVHIDIRRISPYSDRIPDGVTMDLMIHDLDLVRWIAGSDVASVSAVSHDLHRVDDLTTAILSFANGVSATLTASRLGQDKVREITVTQRESVVRVDLIRQHLTVHRVGHVEDRGSGGFRQTGLVEIPFLGYRGEPLLLQDGHFVDCVSGRCEPRVTAADGLASLSLARRVQEAALKVKREAIPR